MSRDKPLSEQSAALEKRLKAKGATLDTALAEIVREVYKKYERIVFNGDGYSGVWHTEAEKKRKLLNLRTTLDAIATLDSKKNIDLFDRLGILSERELVARQEIMYDIYFKTVNIEGETTEYMAQTQILPAALGYLAELGSVEAKSRAADGITREVVEYSDQLYTALQDLRQQNEALGGDEVHEKAHHMRDKVLPAMGRVREAADNLEKVVGAKHWTLPTYRQMLFVK